MSERQDFATQVFHSQHFQAACKSAGVEPGRFVSPECGEHMAGLQLSVRKTKANFNLTPHPSPLA